MLRPNELRSVVNETVREWFEENMPEGLSPNVTELVDELVTNIQEVWFN